jgi:hypothetical protein
MLLPGEDRRSVADRADSKSAVASAPAADSAAQTQRKDSSEDGKQSKGVKRKQKKPVPELDGSLRDALQSTVRGYRAELPYWEVRSIPLCLRCHWLISCACLLPAIVRCVRPRPAVAVSLRRDAVHPFKAELDRLLRSRPCW